MKLPLVGNGFTTVDVSHESMLGNVRESQEEQKVGVPGWWSRERLVLIRLFWIAAGSGKWYRVVIRFGGLWAPDDDSESIVNRINKNISTSVRKDR